MTTRAPIIDGVYSQSYMGATGTTVSLVRSNYGLAYVNTGTALTTRGAEFEGRDGATSNIGVYGYARQINTQTGGSLVGGQFYSDLYVGGAPSKYVSDAYGAYAYVANSTGAGSGTIKNQYGGYFSASANANTTNAYGLYSTTTGNAVNNYGLYINSSANATGTGTE